MFKYLPVGLLVLLLETSKQILVKTGYNKKKIYFFSPETSRLDFGNFTGHLFIAIATIIDVFISDR